MTDKTRKPVPPFEPPMRGSLDGLMMYCPQTLEAAFKGPSPTGLRWEILQRYFIMDEPIHADDLD